MSTPMGDETSGFTPEAEARAVCEHFYASHCYRGMSIRLCMTCHEPDWDDLAEQLASAARGSEIAASGPLVIPQDEALPAEPHMDLLESAWGVIANAGWDDCAKTTGWQEAAVRWRDDYHRWLKLHLRPGGYQTWEELANGLVRERDALIAEVAGLQRALRDAADAKPLSVGEAAEAKLAEVTAYVRDHKGDAGFSWMHTQDILAIIGSEEANHG